jgi:alkaline phosphatase
MRAGRARTRLPMKRRDLIKGGMLAGLAGVTGLGCAVGGVAGAATAGTVAPGRNGRNGAAPGAGARRSPVRNIIFLAYDGFNYEDLAVARYLAGRQGRGPLEIERLLGAGAAGSMLTHSLTAVVTDSAAASTAWGAGRKVVNSALSMYPDGRELTTILELARDAGKATGLITTTRLTHATPAGWIAKVEDREMEDEIATQYFDFRPHVLLGGGRKHFAADAREDGRDLEGEFREAGYQLVRSAAELAGVTGPRVLGAFTDDHLPYEIDRRFQGDPGPSLADITRAGLATLDRHPGGFVVQVEAGRIDHANHANDPGGSVWDILAADDALAVILDFVDRNPDTLLLMGSDHATGGQSLYGIGPAYNQSTPALERLGDRRASYAYLRRVIPGEPSAGQVRDAVRDYLGIRLTDGQAGEGASILARQLRIGHPNAHRDEPGNSFNQLLSRAAAATFDRANVNFATGAHTAGLVPVVAYGAWDGPANLGVVDNTELFGWMARALGSDFRNPEMSEAEALRLSARRPEREMAVM